VTSLIGQQFGDYLLEAELGRGSMGMVYRARHVREGTTYAVKVLLDALTTDTSFITRFTREANVVATLRHPNIIRVYSAGKRDEYLYFVMEYFPGVTAGQLLKQHVRITVSQVLEIAQQTANALAYAHIEGRLVHRDIKPDNLLVDHQWRLKVLDFGLARIEGMESITSAGTVVGSLYYVSPEQLRGHKLDGRGDVYALGVSMYEMLSTKRPFLGHTFNELTTNILNGVYTPLGQLEPSVPLEVERVVARAMARDLDARYASAAEMWHDLRSVQAALATRPSGAPVQPQPDPDATLPLASLAATPQKPVPAPAFGLRRTLRPATLRPLPPDHGQGAEAASRPNGAPPTGRRDPWS
jgi:serine/threonine-protein kinase